MNRRLSISAVIVLLMLLAGRATAQQAGPFISSLIPSQAIAGSPEFSLGVNGGGFLDDSTFNFGNQTITIPGSRVQWRSPGSQSIVELPTIFGSATKLAATVAPSLVTTPGTAQVRVWNSSEEMASNWVSFPIVTAEALTITTTALSNGTVGSAYSQTLAATGGQPPYAWRVSGSLPAGLSLNNTTGVISGTPTEAGTNMILVEVFDQFENADEREFSITILSEDPLVITTASPLPSAVVGVRYQLQFTAEGGMEPYSWNPGGALPPGLSLNNNGVLSGRPSEDGRYEINIRVEDAFENFTNRRFVLDIAPPLEFVTTSPLPDAIVGEEYSLALQVTGGVQPYQWRLALNAPPPLVVLLSNGELRGTPTTAGEYRFIVEVTGSAGSRTSREFVLTSIVAGLSITTPSPLPDGTTGTPYMQQLEVTGGTAPYQWSRIEGSLPPGLTLAATGAVQGTPTTTGEFSFQVLATDSEGLTGDKVFRITITAPALDITTTSPLPEGTEGTSYSLSLAATGGVPPYDWSVIEGSLPGGLALSPAGVITGTPTTFGEFSFRVQVIDNQEETAARTFVLIINEQPADPLVIQTNSPLPNGTVGVVYNQNITATGGVPPFTWSIVQGELPDGLSFSSAGLLSGTPSAAGPFGFTVEVTDQRETINRRHFTLIINPPAVPNVEIGGLPDQSEPAQQPPFDVTLSAPYQLPLTGRVNMGFTPDAVIPADDPAVQFSTGGRFVDFTIPAGATDAVFPVETMAVQTGSVAGTIALTVQMWSNGVEVTPSPQPSRQMVVPRSVPVIRSVELIRTASGFEVRLIGISTPREVTQARFQLSPAAGANLQTTQVDVDVSSAFTTWYQSEGATPFGSAFRYVQPFSVQGNSSDIASVSVTLSNSQGASQPATASF